VITKIPHNLQHTLLLRRTLQAAWLPKEPLTGQFEYGVILRTRPLLKTRLHPFQLLLISPRLTSGMEPR
jgi:hypothetical protein